MFDTISISSSSFKTLIELYLKNTCGKEIKHDLRW